MAGAPADLIEDVVLVGGRDLTVLRPRDSEALLDEAAFDADEFLPYWADLWPSAVILAEHVIARTLRGRRVLELGCGLGLPAICAALAGGRVTATDWSGDAVAITDANAARNGVEVATRVASWHDAAAFADEAPWDLVLAADVLYESRDHAALLRLLPRLTGDTGEVWLAEPGRTVAASFLAETDATGWERGEIAASTDPRVTVHRLRPTGPAA